MVIPTISYLVGMSKITMRFVSVSKHGGSMKYSVVDGAANGIDDAANGADGANGVDGANGADGDAGADGAGADADGSNVAKMYLSFRSSVIHSRTSF